MIDAFLNAGIAIANNGFMIKNSPREGRTMFIAAGTGFAGIVGGVASIGAGAAIAATADWSWMLAGTKYVNFHVLFAASMVLRHGRGRDGHAHSRAQFGRPRVVAGELLTATRLRIVGWQAAIVGQRTSRLQPPADAELPIALPAKELPEQPLRREA